MRMSENILWGGRILGELPALPMGFEANHADHDMTPFMRRCLADGANEFQ